VATIIIQQVPAARRRMDMGQYRIKHHCEHWETHRLYSKEDERQSKLRWLETLDCTECWRAEKRAAESEKATGMTALKGSEKQVTWAISIRQGVIDTVAMNSRGMVDSKLIAMINCEDEARFWINNRDNSAMLILKELILKYIDKAIDITGLNKEEIIKRPVM
jgi:hypothetical protein